MTMPREEVRERIAQLLGRHFGVDAAAVKDGASFRGALGMDSADVIDFVSFLEREFGFDELEGYERLHTVKHVVDFVAAELAKREGAP
jgi:acyl carrier protein